MAKSNRSRGQIIENANGTYTVRVYMGDDPKTGKRTYCNRTVRGSKREAQKVLTSILGEKDKGNYVKPSAITLNTFLDTWLEDVAKFKVKPRTYLGYKRSLARYIRPILGERPIGKITEQEIQNLYAEMFRRGLSVNTVRLAHAPLSIALKHAAKRKYIAHPPTEGVELPSVTRKPKRGLDPEEAGRFIKAIETSPWGTLFLTAMITGMRPGELRGLKWQAVDLKKGNVRVECAVSEGEDGWYFTEPKRGSHRVVPIPGDLVRKLKEHKAVQNVLRLAMGEDYHNYDLVFASANGNPLDTGNLITRHFKTVLKAAKLPSTTRLYDLRHSTASLMAHLGESPKLVAERLGHSDIRMTLDYYTHIYDGQQEAANQKLEDLLYGEG